MKILIVEDNIYIVGKLLELLSEYASLITTTADAEMAQELMKMQWTHILLDHDLPNRWSGWQLLNNTAEYRLIDHAKIIAISAVHENNKRLLQHGAHYAVAKMDCDFGEEIKKLIEQEDGASNQHAQQKKVSS